MKNRFSRSADSHDDGVTNGISYTGKMASLYYPPYPHHSLRPSTPSPRPINTPPPPPPPSNYIKYRWIKSSSRVYLNEGPRQDVVEQEKHRNSANYHKVPDFGEASGGVKMFHTGQTGDTQQVPLSVRLKYAEISGVRVIQNVDLVGGNELISLWAPIH